jgi:cell wall-associated NlpC family hydrolase
VNPNAGPSIAYAAVYADSALSPYGILATRQADIGARNSALHEVQVAEQEANRQARKQASALAAERSESSRLETELRSISLASASAVESDHVSLASQAGKELLAASALEFKSKAPLPAPLSTTPVALAWAFSELGKPYVWGATGPNTFDCSGLTQFVWHAAGVSIPRVAADQDAWTIPVPLSSLLPGDLVFYGKTDIHHVGIYIGDGLMINAPHTGDVVQVSSIWWSDLAGFGRVHAPGTPVPPHQPPTVAKPAPALVIPTAKPVPSQTKPPKGWKPKPGETTPILLGGPAQSGSDGTSQATTTTPPTTIPVTTTTVLGTATTLLPVPDPTTTVTTLPPPSLPEGP